MGFQVIGAMEVSGVFKPADFGTYIPKQALFDSHEVRLEAWNATKIVDIAAGSVILTEAGGEITNFEGEPINYSARSVIASNGLVHDQLLDVLGK